MAKGYLSRHGVRSGTSRSGNQRPQWRGNITIEGKQYWLSGWDSTDRAGKPIVDLRATPKDDV